MDVRSLGVRKKPFVRECVLVVLFLAFSCKQAPSQFTLQYAGNILGEFKTCGCDEKNLGGIEKLGGFLEEKRHDDRYIFLIAGNTFFPSVFVVQELRDHYRTKALLLSRSLSLIKPTAVLVGKKDLTLGVDFLNGFKEELGLSLMSSNLMSRRNEYVFLPYVVKEFAAFSVGIFGLTGDIEHVRLDSGPRTMQREADGVFRAGPLESSRRAVSMLKQLGAEFIILLSDLAKEDEENILKREKDIDLIISTGSGFPTEEPLSLDKQIIVRPFSKLQYIGNLQFGVQGKKRGFIFENIPLIEGIPAHPEMVMLVKQACVCPVNHPD